MHVFEAHPVEAPRASLWSRLRRIRELKKDPTRLADLALLQSELLHLRLSETTTRQVDALIERRGTAVLCPRLDLEGLRHLPSGTFGRAFIDFSDANKVAPVRFTDAVTDQLRQMPAVARYLVTHDMVHVLIGCDTSIPGELGVIGFGVGQGYFRRGRLIYALQGVVGSLMRPHQMRRSLAELRAGYRLGQSATHLLGEPLEEFFAEDLVQLRGRLGLR